MISVDLARALRTAGLSWLPSSGDRFIIDQPELQGQSFVLSDLTVDLHSFRGEQLLGFNGTVEWALDSVTVDQALWLPHEHQLREALGAAFRRLESLGADRVRVVVAVDGGAIEFDDESASSAYGRALLHLLTR
ncbi:MAG: hypothetical protein ACJ71T_07215 [Actinomycetales bacterium]